jgi:hypothetical protein
MEFCANSGLHEGNDYIINPLPGLVNLYKKAVKNYAGGKNDDERQ